ncbi:putative leucine-rich repeat protein [Tanacetum coccineum]
MLLLMKRRRLRCDITNDVLSLDLNGYWFRRLICGLFRIFRHLSSLRILYLRERYLEGALAERIMALSWSYNFWGSFSNLLHGTMTETHLKNLSQLVYLHLAHKTPVIELRFRLVSIFFLEVTCRWSSLQVGYFLFLPGCKLRRNLSIIVVSDAEIKYCLNGSGSSGPGLRYLNILHTK